MRKTDELLEWRVSSKEAGTRLLQFLRDHCHKAHSVKALKRAIESKLCKVNQRIETFSSYILKENDLVALSPHAFEERESPKNTSVLFEDKELLIINKPVGVISDNRELNRYFPSFKGKLELVHRLDKETSGVLILAKTSEAKEKMAALFKKRAVRKVYLALVDGVVEKDEGVIDNFLGKKHSYQGQTIYGAVDEKKGQRAITSWKCLKRAKTASLLACEPYTGRTHQLRVHLSGMGHPILGDTQYGKRFRCPVATHRNLLHAYRISFAHPTTGTEIKTIAPIPSDFKAVLEQLQIKMSSK